jgi:hypothetical protein
MAAAMTQTEFGGTKTQVDAALQLEASRKWRALLWSAIKTFCIGYLDLETGLKGYDGCAYRLNEIWEDDGRPVTGGALRSSLHDSERNNFRLEWIDWFAAQDREIADLVAHRVKPAKTDRQYASDLEDVIRSEHSHKRAEAMIRQARMK